MRVGVEAEAAGDGGPYHAAHGAGVMMMMMMMMIIMMIMMIMITWTG